jgi:hypothetical protein
VVANHFWSSGALVEITKKGNPTDIRSKMNNHGIGFEVSGEVQLSVILIGRVIKTKERRQR